MDGWNKEELDNIGLMDTFDEIEDLTYEIRNCVKGCKSDCYDYPHLAEKLREIAETLNSQAEDVELIEDPEEDPEEED